MREDETLVLSFYSPVYATSVNTIKKTTILLYRIPDGLRELRTLLEQHITNQGLAAIDRCGDSAVNVSNVRL